MPLPPFRRGYGPVPGEGPKPPCRIVAIGECPAFHEAQQGRPFVGKTGDEFDAAFDGQRLPLRNRQHPQQSKIYLTNLYKFYRPGQKEFTTADLQECEPWLIEELERYHPQVVVTLGREATRWCLGDVDMEEVHAIPWRAPDSYYDKVSATPRTIVIFPVFHPAAAFHNPEVSSFVTYGFSQLSAFLKGDFDARTLFDDPFPAPRYEEIATSLQLRAALRDLSGRTTTAVDTEGTPDKPWSLQFSMQPGTAYLIRATRSDLLRAFSRCLTHVGARVAFHNALYDLSMMRAMEIPWEGMFDDTMVMAYLLQVEPQGLKPLCLRWCGMRMQSYGDIIGDAGRRLAMDYLWSLFDIEELNYEQARQIAFEAAKTAGQRIRVLPKLPRTVLHKAVERCLIGRDPRKLWMSQINDSQHGDRQHLGKMPEPTLNHVDPVDAIHYGCRDADGTLRLLRQLRPRLETMRLA